MWCRRRLRRKAPALRLETCDQSWINPPPVALMGEPPPRQSAAKHQSRNECAAFWWQGRARSGLKNPTPRARSEEHTSALQSLMRISYAVFCLKKKTTHKKKH